VVLGEKDRSQWALIEFRAKNPLAPLADSWHSDRGVQKPRLPQLVADLPDCFDSAVYKSAGGHEDEDELAMVEAFEVQEVKTGRKKKRGAAGEMEVGPY